MMDARWIDIGPASQIEPGTARTLPVEGGEEIAVFRTMRGEVYALVNKCPHKGGPLSEGIVHGQSVTCPLHNWVFDLNTGQARGEDARIATYPVRVQGGRVQLDGSAIPARSAA